MNTTIKKPGYIRVFLLGLQKEIRDYFVSSQSTSE
jgi:hypothetical protein